MVSQQALVVFPVGIAGWKLLLSSLELVLYWARPEALKPWLQALSRPGQAGPLWWAYV